MEVNAEDNDGLLVNLVRGASAAVGFQLSSDDVGVLDNAGVCKDKLRQVEHRRAISENVVLEGDMFKVVLHDDDSDFDLNASDDIIFLDEEEGHDSVSLLNEEIINVSDLSLMKTTTEQDANGKETKRKLINIGLEENNEPSAIRNEKRPWDFSNKFLDRSFTALSPSNKKNNLLELEFLKNAERTELSPSAVDADALLTSSNFPSVRIGTASQNEWRKYNLSSHSDDHLKLDDTVSSFASESRIRLENNRNIKTGFFEKILLETLARNSNLVFDEQLKDDAKLWCQTYVKLIDCANLLCLATPSSLYVPRSQKQLLDCSTVKGLSSNNGFKNEATILALSANVGISKRCSKEKGNMFDNSGSQTKTRRRKGRCRSKKTAKAKKPPASQSKLCRPYRRMIIIGSKEGAKAALAGEQDEVICKFDAWRKLHKSKEKKKSSWNPESDKTLSGSTVKQEPIIDFDSLVFRNGCPPVETKASESLSTNIKSEFGFGMDALNTLAHGGSNSNSCQTVITIEPKKDVTNTDFVFIKQEPANDFCYAESSDNATVDQKIPVSMELVCNKLPIGSQPMASETCFDQIYEEKQWLPAVSLKQIPPWILQNLQSSGNE